MTLRSMTGFARSAGETETLRWTWELRSVNGKGLDVRLRLPHGAESIETEARTRIQGGFHRGHIGATLSLSRAADATPSQINWTLLEQFAEAAQALQSRHPFVAPPSADGLLALKGVIEIPDDDGNDSLAAENAAILEGLDKAVADLASARASEGERVHEMIADHVRQIEDLRVRAAEVLETQRDALRAKVAEAVGQLVSSAEGLSADRLEQEVALLYTKADVREELDRLAAHIEQANALLADEKPVGRRLDFLCQEFNREANTLCSKAQLADLSQIGLDLKIAVDQLREQVQNIE